MGSATETTVAARGRARTPVSAAWAAGMGSEGGAGKVVTCGEMVVPVVVLLPVPSPLIAAGGGAGQ